MIRTPTEAEPGEAEVEAMIGAGAKQMRRVLDDGGWADETIFESALEASGILVALRSTTPASDRSSESERMAAILDKQAKRPRLPPDRSTPNAVDEVAALCNWCEQHSPTTDAEGICDKCRRGPPTPAVAVDDDALAMLRRRRSDADSQGGQAEIDALEIDEAIALVQSLQASVRVKDEALREAATNALILIETADFADTGGIDDAEVAKCLRAALSDQQGGE